MKDPELMDGRKIPDEVMEPFRRRAVHAIREKGHSPEIVAQIFGFSRSSVYEWLEREVIRPWIAVRRRGLKR